MTPCFYYSQAVLERFLHFLSIATVSSEGVISGSYVQAADFLVAFGDKLGLESKKFEYAIGKPIVLLKWTGRDPSLPAVLLNSHYDVVPAVKEHWKTDPFKPVLDEASATIFGRGTQDMKSVCMQYLEAIARLKAADATATSPFLRTIYLSYLPDEEVGGSDGAAQFVNDSLFKQLNVGVALDEVPHSFDEGAKQIENNKKQ